MDKIDLNFKSFSLVLDKANTSDFIEELWGLCTKYSDVHEIKYEYMYRYKDVVD